MLAFRWSCFTPIPVARFPSSRNYFPRRLLEWFQMQTPVLIHGEARARILSDAFCENASWLLALPFQYSRHDLAILGLSWVADGGKRCAEEPLTQTPLALRSNAGMRLVGTCPVCSVAIAWSAPLLSSPQSLVSSWMPVSPSSPNPCHEPSPPFLPSLLRPFVSIPLGS